MTPRDAAEAAPTPVVPTPNYRLCIECGWQTRVDREYHPYAACLIVKATGDDPLMVLRQIATDVATLNEEGQFPVQTDE